MQTSLTNTATATATETAAQRVHRLALADNYVRHAGFVCTDAGLGVAEVRVLLKPEHLNFNGTCHGGLLFALADTAFGLAANSYGLVAAGIDAHITYQVPGRVGDELVARATEVSRNRRLSVFRVDIQRADGRALSSFTGTVFITETPHAAPDTGPASS